MGNGLRTTYTYDNANQLLVLASARSGVVVSGILGRGWDVIVGPNPPSGGNREGDVVAILSNGGFGGIYEKLPAKLKSLHEAATPA